MGFIGSMLGAGQGSDFQAAGSANISSPAVSQAQIDASYGGVQNSMQQQQALLNALQQQNGLGNQTNVYNQLQTIASGGGPNPAQAQFRENANQLGAQAAGLMGSQKGMSPALAARQVAQQQAQAQQNVAGQGATALANQQLSALGAAGNMANTMAGNQVGQTNANTQAQQANQQNLLGANAAYNAQQAGVLGNINQTNSATQIQNSKAQQGIFGGLLGGSGAILSDENAKTDIHSADGKIQQFLDSLGAHEYQYKDSVQGEPGTAPGKQVGPMAQEMEQSEVGKQMVTETPQGKGLGISRSEGVILAALAHLNKRLESFEGNKEYADGGMVTPQVPAAPTSQPFPSPFNAGGPQSGFGMFLAGMNPKQEQPNQIDMGGGENPIQGGMSKLTEKLGEKYIKPLFDSGSALGGSAGAGLGSELGGGIEAGEAAGALGAAEGATAAAEGAEAAGGSEALLAALAKGGSVGSRLKVGGKVPGRPKVKGDSYKNDTVRALLSPGEVVIPNSVMQSKDPANAARDFVANVIAKRRGRK